MVNQRRVCLLYLRGRPSVLSKQAQPVFIARYNLAYPFIRTNTTSTVSRMSQSSDIVLTKYGNVPVNAGGLSKEELENWVPFKDWISNLTKSLAHQSHPNHPFNKKPFQLKKITINSCTKFGSKIGFLKVTANVSNEDGILLPGVAFLRGASVAMLVVLIPDDQPAGVSDEAYVPLTVQPRIPTGSLGFVELPAGMMDGERNFSGAAAKEIEEELLMVINENELINLSDKAAEIRRLKNKPKPGQPPSAAAPEVELPFAMYPSAGGCDEYIKIFCHERRVPRSTLEGWKGKCTGLRNKGEMISLKLVPLEDLWFEGGMDAKALAAVTLYTEYKKSEKKKRDLSLISSMFYTPVKKLWANKR